MYTAIDILPGAAADLRTLVGGDPVAVATILAFLQEADADPELIDKLTTNGNVEFTNYDVNVRRWVQGSREENLLRLRILNSRATSYRLVYGYDWRGTRRVGLLAVIHRDEFDYAINGEIGQRILDDWRTATGGGT